MKIFILTTIALLAFAGNSVLCRLALGDQLIDANSFTIVRLISGAITLITLLLLSGSRIPNVKDTVNTKTILRGGYLFFYAALFSYAYIILDTASGALLLFASVQFTMICVQFIQGNKPSNQELIGLLLALIGFVYWMLPSSQSPSLLGAGLMILSGIAWAGYTLAGKHSKNAKLDTTKNFIISVLFIIFLLPAYAIFIEFSMTPAGLIYAVTSGSLASGIGYWIWYSVLPQLSISSAAVLQLLVPILAAIGGFIWTSETITGSFVLACMLILTGILLVVKKQTNTAS
jgi:drug/metabolite transporter (DMT)-like permease